MHLCVFSYIFLSIFFYLFLQKCFIVWLLTTTLVINQVGNVKANQQQHYSYSTKSTKEDQHYHPHHHNYQVADFEDNANNQAINNYRRTKAQEAANNYRIYGVLKPQHDIHTPPLSNQQQNPQNKFNSIQYNVQQHLDDKETDIIYHHPTSLEHSQEMTHTQQERPSLLDQLKSQQQDLSEGYAAFLQDEQNER